MTLWWRCWAWTAAAAGVVAMAAWLPQPFVEPFGSVANPLTVPAANRLLVMAWVALAVSTLAYGLLTVLLGPGYAGLVLVGGQVFGGVAGEPPSWAVAAATLAVAAGFQPARSSLWFRPPELSAPTVAAASRQRG